MKELSDYTKEELEQELKKRDIRAKEVPNFLSDEEIIKQIPKIKEFLQNNIKNIANTGYALKDFDYYCFENLTQWFYGNDFFDWYNKACEER